MKSAVSKLYRAVASAVVAAAGVVLVPAAAAWRIRAEFLELAAAGCLAYFVAGHLDRGAWLVGAAAAAGKATEISRRRAAL